MAKVFSVFAQNLGAYSEGNIVGDWIDLPQKKEVIENTSCNKQFEND